MGRTKEFDPAEALDRALELFWEHGYEATSMADLVAHLGIGRASLYATFGDKRELYHRALRRYEEWRAVIDPLSQPGPALPAVHAFIDVYVAESLADDHRRGCMIVNAAVERAAADPEAARCVQQSWDRLETALASALIRARAQGELPPQRDPKELAAFLLVLLQGMRVLARADPDPARLHAAARQAKAILS